MIDPFWTATELRERIRERSVSVSEVVRAQLERISALNPKINAIVMLDADGALERARRADRALSRGETWGELHGVPFTLKDAHDVAGMRTTCGDPSLDRIAKEDGTVAARLKKAGGILLGKTNVPPMLVVGQTLNEIFGLTRNPWDLERTVGSSSGGSAAAVAAGFVPFDVGTDFSGSIRMPAHYNGVFGFKPSTNRLPITGSAPVPPAPRADRFMATVGPLTRSVDDLELVARTCAGPDGVDLEVVPLPWRDEARRAPQELKIAFLPEFAGIPTAREVVRTVERTAADLERRGARVEQCPPGFALDDFFAVWTDYFRMFSGATRELLGIAPPVSSEAEAEPSIADWMRVLSRRDELIVALERLLHDFDAFLCPAGIAPAFSHCPPLSAIPVDEQMVEARFFDHYLLPFNFTGSPAVVLPANVVEGGLPIGIQLVGRRWGDEALLAVARAVVEVTGEFRRPRDFG